MYQQHVPPHQIKHSLPTITVKHPRTGDLITWRNSQPVKIWSQSASKWCPGEISYITQDADGYCLDVRYWARPQLPKAKYLAPLSDCLRPISSDFVCRTDWASGSKVECFSNSQKRWYKATVVDVIRYPDDKEDWLKIQWSLDTLPNVSSTPSSSTSNSPQIMSKEVGRSSIWIRHRYPSLKDDSPPNAVQTQFTPKQPPSTQKKQNKKSKKRKKASNKMNEEVINEIISSHPPNRGPQSKEISFTSSEVYNDANPSQIRKFQAHHNESRIENFGGPQKKPTKSKKVSSASSRYSPEFTAISPQDALESNKEAFDYILDKMDETHDDTKSLENDENDDDLQGSPEFGAEFKPDDYKEKEVNLKDLDDDLDKAFMSSDSSESDESQDTDIEPDAEENASVSNDGSMIINNTDEEDEEGEEDTESEEEGSLRHNNKEIEPPVLLQSGSRLAMHSNHGPDWEEEKKELLKEIEDLKFRVEIAEQDLTEERETSGPLLKEVEMQKISIAKLEEKNKKLKKRYESAANLSPVQSPSGSSNDGEDNEHDAQHKTANESKEKNDEMTAKLMEFKKTLNNPPRSKSKRSHIRSFSFTSNSSLQSIADTGADVDFVRRESSNNNRFEGLRAQELIDAVYDRKVTLLNEKIARQQLEDKKKDRKIAEYKQSAQNYKGEIAILEAELAELKQLIANQAKNKVDIQNIAMYRDQVRKLTQTNEILKKTLQTADDNLKSAELKKQDLSEEFKAQRQITHTIQQKVQRVLQQNNTITTQIEALHSVLVKTNPLDSMQHAHMHSHSRHYSMSAAHNHLDTIRKCNMRSMQVLHEIMDKRRKRSNVHRETERGNKYGQRDSINLFHGNGNMMEMNSNINAAKRKSKIEYQHTNVRSNGSTQYNHEDIHTINNNHHHNQHHSQHNDYERYHSTKSTRFSDKSNKLHKTPQSTAHGSKAFDFESAPVPYSQQMNTNDPTSTRSRGYVAAAHHQERSIHSVHRESNHDKGNMLAVGNNENNNNYNGSNRNASGSLSGSGQYNVRMKRVSYDYVDGSHYNKHNKDRPTVNSKLYNQQIQHISEEHDRDEPQLNKIVNRQRNHASAYDMNQYFDKIWTVKFPRRSSKVGLFHSNKGLKTKIILDKTQIIFKCDTDQLLIKLLISQINSYEISDKKNVSIYTKNGKKYKIKCEDEKQAAFWHNTLSQYIAHQ